LSHQPERKEKNCLNCGTRVIGRFCHVCGQENVETRENFWSLAKHFVFDILHFDGKFFHTLKYLLTRPGFVARQYCEGKRNSYLHPIRMYLFTSAVFFLLFFAASKDSLQIKETPLSEKDRVGIAGDLKKELLKKPGDTLILRQLAMLNDTKKEVYGSQFDTSKSIRFFMGNSRKYNSVSQYDSVQRALPEEKRDNWFMRKLTKRGLEVNHQYKDDMRQGLMIMWTDFLHKLPYMLFLSLPFFAVILKLLYIRRKNFFYSDHAVFTLYHYILSFILLLVLLGLRTLRSGTGWGFLSYPTLVLFIAWPIYLLLEMKSFYRQGWLKTVGKFFLLDLLGFMVIMVLFIGFVLISVFEA
jgi:Protein of unknown function (DUF3667)